MDDLLVAAVLFCDAFILSADLLQHPVQVLLGRGVHFHVDRASELRAHGRQVGQLILQALDLHLQVSLGQGGLVQQATQLGVGRLQGAYLLQVDVALVQGAGQVETSAAAVAATAVAPGAAAVSTGTTAKPGVEAA
ncbi:hypothetical protein CRUP_003033 [Coryphaenoides rupestris]|nr:hypothetical protein CRUP_003033 [Coryphaenoides rupestris]